MTTTEIDQTKAQAFGGQLIGYLNHAMMMLMTSIGHRTGLFDAMAELPPSTSKEIADAAKLDERYVREWLGSLTTGGVVLHDRKRGTYALPPEHAASLTRAAGPNNFGSFAQYIALFANVEDAVVDCFRKGGGVPYSAFTKFQALQAEESAMIHDAVLIGGTLPMVPGIVPRLETGIDVLDVGCGQGHAANLIAKAFPNSRVRAYDFSDEGIAHGKKEAAALGLTNSHHEVRDVTSLAESERYDFITAFDTIHDQARPDLVLRGIYEALRSGGTFLCVDIAGHSELADNMDHPMAPALYGVSTMHCMTVSLAMDGMGLGTMWGEEKARAMLGDAGFPDVTLRRVEGDILNNYYIARK